MKERIKRTMDNSKDSPKDPKVLNGTGKIKTSKISISSLENFEIRNKLGKSGISVNWERFTPLRRRGLMMNGNLMNATTAGVVLDGMNKL